MINPKAAVVSDSRLSCHNMPKMFGEVFYGVGIIREPTPEEMEEYFREHISKKPSLKAKTA